MSILNQLSSQVGDRTESANVKVAAQCLRKSAWLSEIAAGLQEKDAALLGDCAEVFSKVAEEQPVMGAPYAKTLAGLLTHKTTRVRWEAMHALALCATAAPKLIASLLPQLSELIRHDSSVIVRDYAVDAIGNYASTGRAAAEKAFPLLQEALSVWDGKQAGHALNGLVNVVSAAPRLCDEARTIAHRYLSDGRGVVRKAAKALAKATEAE